MSFTETEEQQALRAAVAQLGAKYGYAYSSAKARADQSQDELWAEAGQLGYLGVNLPEEYGGGGQGMYELAIVEEELSAAGCGLLMMVVSPAICGTVITRFGTDEQKGRWLPGLADGSSIMAFGITEPDAGSNSHKITTTARRDGTDWLLSGQKVFISGVDVADNVLIVCRTEDARTGTLKPVLLVVPTDSPGFEKTKITMDLVARLRAATQQLVATHDEAPERRRRAARARTGRTTPGWRRSGPGARGRSAGRSRRRGRRAWRCRRCTGGGSSRRGVATTRARSGGRARASPTRGRRSPSA